jgi:2-C-methyl-D-erythritol 4-phosphate cytidylyltransferase
MPRRCVTPLPTSICIVDDASHKRHVIPSVDVEAVVPAAGQGTRLGLGPKAFVILAGRTLLEHAVTTMLSVTARVSVAVAAADLARARDLVGGPSVHVIAGGTRRIDTLRALVGGATSPWLLLHDIVHPFVTGELSRSVIEEAYRAGAAAAAQTNVDFLYGKDGVLRATPGEVVAIQKPVVFRRSDAVRGFEVADGNAAGGLVPDLSVLGILALAGRTVAFIPGHTLNYKVTTGDDLTLAERLMARI